MKAYTMFLSSSPFKAASKLWERLLLLAAAHAATAAPDASTTTPNSALRTLLSYWRQHGTYFF